MSRKIAFAHDHLFQIGGAERVLAVLTSLDNQAPIYTLINNPKSFCPIAHKLNTKNQLPHIIPITI